MDEIQAAVLLIKLKYLENWNNLRRINHSFYRKFFIDLGLTIESERNSLTERNFVIAPHRDYANCDIINYHTFHQYSILVNKRDELKKCLTDCEIGSDIYYPVPLHKQKCFKEYNYNDKDFPNTNFVCEHIISLPIYPEISQTQINEVASTIGKFYSNK